MGETFAAGILADHQIEQAVSDGMITTDQPLEPLQIQRFGARSAQDSLGFWTPL